MVIVEEDVRGFFIIRNALHADFVYLLLASQHVAPRFGDCAGQVHILRTPDTIPPNGPLYSSFTLDYGSESSLLSRFSDDRTLVDADGALPTPAKDAIKRNVFDKMTGAVKTVGGKLKKRMKINRPPQEPGPIPVSISAEKALLPVSSEVTGKP